MFTGIIQGTGKIASLVQEGDDARITIATQTLNLSSAQIGDSIAVNGICLTATHLTPHSFAADISHETLQRSTLGKHHPGDTVNLEKALTLSTPLGGHLVMGHVDGVGQVETLHRVGRSVQLKITLPPELLRYIAPKGSICIDGISLTVNDLEIPDGRFSVNIVPHTLSFTTLAHAIVGQKVNLEVDVVARYLERLLQGTSSPLPQATATSSAITQNFLASHGFL